MTEDAMPIPEPRDVEAYRSLDPCIIGGLIAAGGAALGPALGEVTGHLLSGQGEPEQAPPQVELPPGVDVD
jgi:hypothetical protein